MTATMDEIARRCLEQLEACVERNEKLVQRVAALEARIQEVEAVVYDSESEAEEITNEESLDASSSMDRQLVVRLEEGSSLSDDDDDSSVTAADDTDTATTSSSSSSSDEVSVMTTHSDLFEADRIRSVKERENFLKLLRDPKTRRELPQFRCLTRLHTKAATGDATASATTSAPTGRKTRTQSMEASTTKVAESKSNAKKRRK
jgi:hypothetical protein